LCARPFLFHLVPVRSLISRLRFRHTAAAVRLVFVLLFLGLVSRYWNPHYGFTQFLQCDPITAAVMLPRVQEARLYVNRDPGSYDGFYYAQIATAPTLSDPALKTAIDNPGYRARRILLSAIAWALGRGEPDATLRAYAALNIGLWLVFAAICWRLFPLDDPRATLAWIGILFAAGTLLGVRFALPDLAATLLLALAVRSVERQQPIRAGVWIGLGALARDTTLFGLAALWPESTATRKTRIDAVVGAVLAVAPLALWILYVWTHLGPSGAGLNNFAWPFVGWFNKLRAIANAVTVEQNHALVATTALAVIGLTVQAMYLLVHARVRGPWWRVGLAFIALLASLGAAVWGDDFPGASVRVLLPLSLAFNVLAVRHRSSWIWLFLGNLSVGSGVLALWLAPIDAHEVATGRFNGGTYIVHSSDSWFPAEGRRGHTWAWCPDAGNLIFDTWPRSAQPRRVSLGLHAFSPRRIQISQNQKIAWEGVLPARDLWIELPAQTSARWEIQIVSLDPPGHENAAAGGRPLSFALSGVRIE
jgi:hypothetical protein